MLNKLATLLFLACASALTGLPAAAQSNPELTLTRLDCGTPVLNDVGRFNDAYAYNGLKVLFTFSCYLIKHGDEYLMFFSAATHNSEGTKRTLGLARTRDLNSAWLVDAEPRRHTSRSKARD